MTSAGSTERFTAEDPKILCPTTLMTHISETYHRVVGQISLHTCYAASARITPVSSRDFCTARLAFETLNSAVFCITFKMDETAYVA